jgi:Carboxypeptidase regulatory-like domain/TonB-dependent Receptor Plug Domain
MRGNCVKGAFAACLMFAVAALGQVGINATLGGTVSDPTGALIPGVEVTAKNVNTGVVSTAVTNESGAYRFPSLQPGSYEVNAALPGFQPQAFRLTLGTAQQINQNFTLQVGTVAQAVEVTAAADELLTAVTASVGTVLPSNQMKELPLVSRNVMDLVTTTMPGVTGTGNADSTFAGITANASANVSIAMDGVTMNTGRHTQGLKPTFFVNPDMIDEMRVVVAPVDAEGRGAAQIQMRAKSGTNQFHAAATWNIRNSALNANTWSNNRLGNPPLWYNRHETTESVSGPIIKNKTFFFVLYDRNDQAQKEVTSSAVLTPLARQGIFRYFPGVNNGNADTTASGLGNNRIAAVVDKAGNPLDPSQIPGATGPMRSFSVFGDSLNPGDPFRTQMDSTGYIAKIIQAMPQPNAYDGPSLVLYQGSCVSCGTPTLTPVPNATTVDGLNTAVHRWVRRTVGADAGGTGQIIDAYNRNQINIKIDHNINQKHRLSGTWVRENHFTDNQDLSPWPNGYNGETIEKPRVRTLNFTSTLTANLLNEFRYGYRSTSLFWDPAIETPGVKDKALAFLPVINGYPVYIRPTLFPQHVIGASSDFGNKSPLTTFTDTMSWTHGKHAFKGGIEFRSAYTSGYQPTPATSQTLGLIPTVTGGAGGVPVSGLTANNIAGLLANNATHAQNLLLMLSGSVGSTSQRFETWEPTDTQFIDYKESYHHAGQPENTRGKIRENHQNEFNFFFKDDWKIRPNLTLNLGFRYDLFRVPDFRSGTGHFWTRGPVDGNAGYFGISGRNFNEGFHNGGVTKAGPTEIVLIGTDSKYPDLGLWPSDKNNFSPAIGFSWAPNLGGKDKTTIRGGYQISYLLPGNSLSWIDADSGRLPGLEFSATDSGGATYRDLTKISFPLAFPSSIPEKVVVGADNRSTAQAFYAPDYVSPYVQTFTLGITRSLPSSMILDVRYVGTRGVKLHSTLNYNEPDFQYNGLLQALAFTRAGGNDPMFDRMFKNLNFGTNAAPLIVGQNVTGSEALRRNTAFQSNLANGDFRAVANTLNTTNIGVTIPPGQTLAGRTLASSGLFPDNFIVANPQFSTMEMRNNSDNSTYHSMETQLTMRPKHGISYQATWTWSRATGVAGNTPAGGGIIAAYRDFLNRHADYTVASFHRTHNFRGYGTFELPFGPGKLLGNNAPKYVAHVIGGWQFGTIFNVTTGAPLNVSARNTINTTGTPDIVGNFPRNGKVAWGSTFGNYFGGYQRVPDPACANVASDGGLSTFCTNTAIADASGKIILQNAAPGQLGTLGLRPIYGPGSWSLDANLQKRIRFAESRSFTLRIDASNILNHPTPGNPNLNINDGTFGEIQTKTGNRTLAGQLRLEF